MHVNIHAHVFTLRTVLSREAVRIIAQRLADHGVPGLLVEAVARVLDGLLDRPEVLDEREILARLFEELREAAGFDDFLEDHLARLPFELVIRGEGLRDLPVETLRQALDQLTTALDAESDGGPRGLGGRSFDIVATLRLALRTTITEVADELLDQIGPNDAVAALMMDIRAEEEPGRDRKNFLRQIEGTREAALQRPGRVLPFFAVHPGRPDHFELMQEAIGSGAFVGVKLYPSLGYAVGSRELRRVYAYCLEEEVPVLLHCSHGGFYRDAASVDFCDPRHWEAVLDGPLAELRVCFAHFGGWESLGRPDGLDEGTWGGTILRLMRESPNVFTDLSFHTDQMRDPDAETHYFRRLEELLRDERLRGRILFGTDSWLLRLEMTEAVFWRYYRDRMSEEDFAAIASAAPRAFLGFPEDAGGVPKANLQRHVEFLASHRERVGAEPAEWLRAFTAGPFEVDREPADWRRRSYPTQCTYRLMREHMTSAQRAGGYAANRTLVLRELRYFRPRDPNFAGVLCLGLARDLVGCCESAGGSYAASWDRASAVERLREVFRRGDKRLVDVASLLDMIFEFDEALV